VRRYQPHAPINPGHRSASTALLHRLKLGICLVCGTRIAQKPGESNHVGCGLRAACHALHIVPFSHERVSSCRLGGAVARRAELRFVGRKRTRASLMVSNSRPVSTSVLGRAPHTDGCSVGTRIFLASVDRSRFWPEDKAAMPGTRLASQAATWRTRARSCKPSDVEKGDCAHG
jgi:hypothetical protein